MDPRHLESLQAVLQALASKNRLHLLLALQQPKRLADITLAPTRSGWGGRERPISRQAVRNQLRSLQDLGAVSAVEKDGETRYVVNHSRLFEVTEQLRELATVKPAEAVQQETLALDERGRPGRPSGPHLFLVRGVNEGHVWPLGAAAPADGWLVGRAKEAEVCLDYDPYVSSAHARILAKEGRHWLLDLRSKNRTHLNLQPLQPGSVAPLDSGDLVGLGMSLLLYRR